MAAERALAIVVRGTDWSETSRITTLFTREFGKIRGLAKGGRRLRSSFEIAFDLLTVCHIVFLKKASGGLDLLTEAQQAERFPHLRTDLPTLYIGYYIAELLADGTADYDPHPGLFDAALLTLRSLADPAIDRPAAVAAFELVWLKELGYSPTLDVCVVCGIGVPPTSDTDFSPAAGGVVCPTCRGPISDRRRLPAAARQAVRGLANGGRELPAAVRSDVRTVLSHAISSVLGRRPRMTAYLDGSG